MYRRLNGGWFLDQTLEASDRAAHDFYGAAAGTNGTYAIIGAELADPLGDESGAAYSHVIHPARSKRGNQRVR
ncbi:MAG: FG-GAP repeat protein [Planctomycetota bacterium]